MPDPPELAMHTPLRPFWICRTDAQPWPCADAKLDLTHGFRDRQVELYLYLGAQFVHALADLTAVNPAVELAVEPDAIHHRFLGWVRVRRPR
ncbi:hypothetical protein [Micromonospora sp. NBC_01796]|uniref:hypothetical protein n=1 Tax=Micromonospora sp. NBC_01796 TaxID=2975987 RepID=UPI002DD8DC27|nr:hypothetical protein [Micromonospora sp. NBC_01796]WSA84514.1 hypothetical protein OIE47_29780 [Micromonospora sp. NBC_01796]